MKNLINKIFDLIGRRDKPSLLAINIVEFTNESWLTTIQKQGRLYEYLANSSNNKTE
jgi:hypothetical protein